MSNSTIASTRGGPSSWLLFLGVAAGLPLVGCGETGETIVEGTPVTVEVMHVGAPGYASEHASERVRQLSDELSTSPADVICLNGLWDEDARDDLLSAVSATFAHSLVLPTTTAAQPDDATDLAGQQVTPVAEPACTGADVAVLSASIGCLASCTVGQNPASPLRAEGCLRQAPCANDVASLSAGDERQRCALCLSSHVRAGATLATAEQRCREQEGNPLVHDGAHGLVLLSKHPLDEPALYVLPSTTHRRAVISARARVDDASFVAFCTSLGHQGVARLPSEPAEDAPYPGAYGAPDNGWAMEQALQTERLLEHVAQHQPDGTVVVMGNFGASPGVVEDGDVVVEGAGASTLERLAEVLVPLVPVGHTPTCTVCPDNVVAQRHGAAIVAPTWTNRAYGRGVLGVDTALRVYLGDVVDVEPEIYPGTPLVGRMPLSAQYAHRVVMRLP